MKRTLCWITTCWLFLNVFVGIAFAAPISKQQALKNTQAFLAERGKRFEISSIRHAPSKSATAERYYVFNIDDNAGFVIASGDDCAPAILGYADSGSVDVDSMPDNMKGWLEEYATQIEYMEKHNINSSRILKASSHAAISPLLTTTWDQGIPYAMLSPRDFNGSRCYAGCVATAMAQVMYYHRGKSVSATTATIPAYDCKTDYVFGEETLHIHVDEIPEGSVIDWNNMLNSYTNSATTAQKQAVANLMLYCGASVLMDYGPFYSGAYTRDVAFALKTFFNYDQNCECVSRSAHSDEDWDGLIYNELANNRPVIYSGANESDAHAFVCDGFDGNGYYHINWGWSGTSDGYFLLSALDPEVLGAGASLSGFNSRQQAIINAQPRTSLPASGTGIIFADGRTKYICVQNWDTNGDGALSEEEAAAVTDLGEVFAGKTSITSFNELQYFTGLTSIDYRAFPGCSNLTSITIPRNVTSIDINACYGCSGLTSVRVDVESPPKKGLVFPNRANATLYVPFGCKAAYEAADYWKEFKEIVEFANTSATDISLDKTALFLEAEQTAKLTATINPSNVFDKKVTWTSSNPSVATVNGNGVVTAFDKGVTTITATTNDGSNLSASCQVAVDMSFVRLRNRRSNNACLASLEKGSVVGAQRDITQKSQVWILMKFVGGYWICNANTGEYLQAEFATSSSRKHTLYIQDSPNASGYSNISSSSDFEGKTCLNLGTNGTSVYKWTFSGDSGCDWEIEPVDNFDYEEIRQGMLAERPHLLTVEDGSYYRILSYYDRCLSFDAKSKNLFTEEQDDEDYRQYWQLHRNGNGWSIEAVLPQEYIQRQTANYQPYALGSDNVAFNINPVDDDWDYRWTISYDSDDKGIGDSRTMGHMVSPEYLLSPEVGWSFEKVELSEEDIDNKRKAYNAQLVTSIRLNIKTITLSSPGAQQTIKAIIKPENATDKSVTWTSSDTNVATVDENGVVTAVSNGTATITATTNDGSNLSATCTVTVAIPALATGITLNESTLSFDTADQTATLTATVTPEDAKDKSVTWTSSDTNVATVDENGVVTAIANGTATITAKTNDGSNLSATCAVTVAIQSGFFSNNTLYTLTCKRGGMVMNAEGTGLAAGQTRKDAPEADKRFAIITYDGAQYLYSPTAKQYLRFDGSFVSRLGTPITFDDTHADGAYEYMLSTKNENGETLYFNNNGEIVINSWDTPDDGNRWLIEPVADFDPTEALALAGKQTYTVTYEVQFDGQVVATATEKAGIGDALPATPASLTNDYIALEKSGTHPSTVTEDVTVAFTAMWNGPFQFSKSVADAKWYNMHIRSGYYIGKQNSEPYYPQQNAGDALKTDAYHWAFGGDPYHVKVYNRTTGFSETLTKDGDNAVMRAGDYTWDLLPNADGFVLRETGTSYNCVNQFGGNTGPLQFWDSTGSPTDNGSTFRVEEAQELSVGIGTVNHESLTVNQPIYNLNGQRLTKPVKGVNIINGKKVAIK